ncbi:MAG: recombinase family protein [Clostridia bacterium]|nr:recombinase family protein [Clostridia bacterium]
MGVITKIEPKGIELPRKQRVAAYARVSTDTERLMNSLAAQISYYSELIQKNPKWEYAGVYADGAKSGGRADLRKEFNKMLEECENGRIDIILCKSISRFARNTVDLLETVRHLKEIGVEVHFEKENINSMTSDGEFMLTILASFAQEEIRSTSENLKWSVRNRFEKGIPNHRTKIIGYDWIGEDLVIVPEEAEVVKRIFQRLLEGKSYISIINEFHEEGVYTKRGGHWTFGSIRDIIANPTYTGRLVLQRIFVEDPITKRQCKNKGELPQYIVENHHEAIIDQETFERAQQEVVRRKAIGPAFYTPGATCFTSKIKCPYCKVNYTHTTQKCQHSPSRGYWICSNARANGRSSCKVAGTVKPVELIKAMNEVLELEEFDDKVFLDKVDYISIPARDTAEVHLKDGSVVTKDCSSKASERKWSPELRAIASQNFRNRPYQYVRGGTCFTHKIYCVQCDGQYIKSMSRACKSEYFYRCNVHKQQGRCLSLKSDALMKLSARVLEIDDFDEDVFDKKIQRINVDGDILEYVFYDGKSVKEKYIKPKRKGQPISDEQKRKMSESTKKWWAEKHEYENKTKEV